jgi:hypothetical protein
MLLLGVHQGIGEIARRKREKARRPQRCCELPEAGLQQQLGLDHDGQRWTRLCTWSQLSHVVHLRGLRQGHDSRSADGEAQRLQGLDRPLKMERKTKGAALLAGPPSSSTTREVGLVHQELAERHGPTNLRQLPRTSCGGFQADVALVAGAQHETTDTEAEVAAAGPDRPSRRAVPPLDRNRQQSSCLH